VINAVSELIAKDNNGHIFPYEPVKRCIVAIHQPLW